MRRALVYIACAFAALIAVGCSTFYDVIGDPGGRLQVFVDWPAGSRHLPSYAKSVVVHLIPECCMDPQSQIMNLPANAPARTDVSFWKVPRRIQDDEGNDIYLHHECYIEAMSQPDGKGTVVGTLDFYFRFDEFNYYKGFNVTADIELTAVELRADAPASIKVGETATLKGYGVDRNGYAIILPPGALIWSADSGQQFADITPDGKVTGKAEGAFKAKLREVDGQVAPIVVSIPIVVGK